MGGVHCPGLSQVPFNKHRRLTVFPLGHSQDFPIFISHGNINLRETIPGEILPVPFCAPSPHLFGGRSNHSHPCVSVSIFISSMGLGSRTVPSKGVCQNVEGAGIGLTQSGLLSESGVLLFSSFFHSVQRCFCPGGSCFPNVLASGAHLLIPTSG